MNKIIPMKKQNYQMRIYNIIIFKIEINNYLLFK